jgi:hypothetical protein
MRVDFLRFLPPRLPAVLEVSDQFLFLRVYADPWVARTTELFTLCGNVPELLIPLSMWLAGVQHLSMTAQPIVLLS